MARGRPEGCNSTREPAQAPLDHCPYPPSDICRQAQDPGVRCPRLFRVHAKRISSQKPRSHTSSSNSCPVTSGPNCNRSRADRDGLRKVIEKYGVDLTLSGHCHNYERLYPYKYWVRIPVFTSSKQTQRHSRNADFDLLPAA